MRTQIEFALRYKGSATTLALAYLIVGTLYWFGTWWGIGVRPDSVTYLGLSQVTDPQAPGYTLLIRAWVAVSGLSPTHAAWWCNLLILFVNITLVWFCLKEGMRSTIGAALTLLLVILLPIFLYVHVTALSDSLFIALLLSSLLLLARYGETGGLLVVVLGGIATGLALVTRFAGAPIVPAGVMFILLFSPSRPAIRMLHASLFALAAALLYLGCMALVGGSGAAGTGREFALLGNPSWETFRNGFDSLSSFFLPTGVPAAVRLVVVAGLIVFLVYAAAIYAANGIVRTRSALVPQIMMIFAACYGAFVLISVFIEANLPFQPRYLAPLYITGAIALAIMINGWASPARLSRLGLAFAVLAGVLAAENLVRSAKMSVDHMRDGNYYASPRWFNSPTIAFVRALGPDVTIFTNAPDAIGYLAGRPAYWIPKKFDRRTGGSQMPFAGKVAELKQTLATSKALVVYFNEIDFRFYLPSESELVTLLDLRPIKTASDGTIYGR